MEQHYKIYFDGKIADNFNPDEVKKRAQAVFRLTDEKMAILFNGAEHTLRDNLTQTACEQYLQQLRNIGLIAKSQPPLPDESEEIGDEAHSIAIETEEAASTPELLTKENDISNDEDNPTDTSNDIDEDHKNEDSYESSEISESQDINTDSNSLEDSEPEPEQKPKAKKTSKPLLIVLLLVVVLGGGVFAWQSGMIELPFLDSANTETVDSITITPKKQAEPQQIPPAKIAEVASTTTLAENTNTSTEAEEVLPPKPQSMTVEKTIIEECNAAEITNLLGKILSQGIPQLVQRSSPDINLTIQSYTDNQELYFDSERNKRLCSVLAKYKVDAPNISSNIDEPFIMYEIIYEAQKDDDNAVRLNTFRQKILSSNLQSSDNTDKIKSQQN